MAVDRRDAIGGLRSELDPKAAAGPAAGAPRRAIAAPARLIVAGLVLATGAGCRWLPSRHPSASLDPRTISHPGPGLRTNVGAGPGTTAPPLAADGPMAAGTDPRGPQPGSPLRPVSDAEALAVAPTPMLDAALARAQSIQPAPEPTSVPAPAAAPAVATVAAPEASRELAAPNLFARRPPATGSDAPPPRDPQVQPAGLEIVSAPPGSNARVPEPEPGVTPVALDRGLIPPRAPGEPFRSKLAAESEPPEIAWRTRLDSLLALASRQLEQPENPARDLWAARVRLLSRVSEADGADAGGSRTELWQALVSLLADAEARSEAGADEPAAGATDAVAAEAAEPALGVTDLQLCRHVDGFGSYEPAGPDDLKAGRAVMLYWEVEGLRTEHDGDWYRTRFAVEAAILPAEGTGDAPIWHESLGQDEDVCRRPRRDYFINCEIALPERLAPGPYRLRLTLRDRIAGTHTERIVAFTVAP